MQSPIRYWLLATLLAGTVSAASVITSRLDDPKAVYLSPTEFGAVGDGQADDSTALQAAIDKAENRVREGILFVPSGRYRITRTIYVWPGVRIFGYGTTRPVVVLGANTPGFQKGLGVMVMFTGARPGAGPAAEGRGFRIPFPPVGSGRRTIESQTRIPALFIRPSVTSTWRSAMEIPRRSASDFMRRSMRT